MVVCGIDSLSSLSGLIKWSPFIGVGGAGDGVVCTLGGETGVFCTLGDGVGVICTLGGGALLVVSWEKILLSCAIAFSWAFLGSW